MAGSATKPAGEGRATTPTGGRVPDRRHRVAMVLASPFPAPRGTQAYVAELGQALAGLGHEVHLWCYAGALGGPLPEGVRVHRAPRVPGVPAALRSAPGPARPINDAALITALLRDLPRVRPTVIHGHNHEGGLAAGVAGRVLGLPVVHHVHGALAEELPAWLPGLRRAARLAGALVDRAVPRLASAVLTLDEPTAARLRRWGLTGVTALPPGIGAAPLSSATDPLADGGRTAGWLGADALTADRRTADGLTSDTIVYAGNLDPYQDLPLLRAAFAQVRRARPAARLVLVTHDRPPPGAWADPGLEVRVVGGFDAVCEATARATVAVVPRTGPGGYPIKLLNALSAGVPVVAARPAAKGLGAAEGVLPVDPDPAALAAGLLAVLAEPARRAALAEAAARFAAAHPWETAARQVAVVYDRVVGLCAGAPRT